MFNSCLTNILHFTYIFNSVVQQMGNFFDWLDDKQQKATTGLVNVATKITDQTDRSIARTNQLNQSVSGLQTSANNASAVLGRGPIDLILYGENDESAHYYKPDNKRKILLIIIILVMIIIIIMLYKFDLDEKSEKYHNQYLIF